MRNRNEKLISETRILVENIRNMIKNDHKVFLKYTNKSTRDIKNEKKRTKDRNLIFILDAVLDSRYKKKK